MSQWHQWNLLSWTKARLWKLVNAIGDQEVGDQEDIRIGLFPESGSDCCTVVN